MLEIRWQLKKSAEKLLGTSDYLLEEEGVDIMEMSANVSQTVTSMQIKSGSAINKIIMVTAHTGVVRLFAEIVDDHDHQQLEPITTKIVVSWWQLLDVVASSIEKPQIV